jgi:alkanesulfonate monooxygenase SsuD/methylene tetrahydromethanopterin reductase-like flavin-dependent oxidoreductase (luciferase family)
MSSVLELGLDTFGDVTTDENALPLPQAQVIRNVVDEAVLADKFDIDFFGVGEHHRADFAVSSPEVLLAAIAGRASRIRLGSAVTVLSSDDPIRVFQRFPRSTRCRTEGPKSYSGAVRSRSRFLFSALN